MMLLRNAAVAALVFTCAARAHAQELPEWQLGEEPVLRLGASLDGDPAEQFFDVSSARRLSDGGVLVLDAGSRELRRFTADGDFVARAGRQGAGPGEFESPQRLYRQRDGQWGVFDGRLARMSYYTTSLNHVRDEREPPDEGRTFQRDVWLTGRYWVDALGAPYSRSVVDEVLRRIGAPADEDVARVLVTRDGLLWIRSLTETTGPWTIYDGNGAVLGTVVLPTGFEPYEIGADYVLGRTRGADDAEFVVLHALARPAQLTAEMAPSAVAARGEIPESDRTAIRGAFRMLAMQQELHYAEAGEYTSDIDALDVKLPGGLSLLIPRASGRGWMGLAFDARYATVCGMAVGSAVPVGWPAGRVFCGDPL